MPPSLLIGSVDWHNHLMEDQKPKWRDLPLMIEFWFAMLLTMGVTAYGIWSAVSALFDGK
ncbi:hypothetical protein FG91_02259 [Sphingopyxis sp. LC81]|nr:hypothetical protein FG91_02259 [Sphingopyxis sp. LC81]